MCIRDRAPAAIGAGIPSPWAMPIKAMPIVPAVPQEVDVYKRQMLYELLRQLSE